MKEDWIFRVRNLGSVRRCGTIPALHQQNVAEHSFYVALIAMDMAQSYEGYVDTGELLRKALLHDAEEAFTGDIPHHVKRVSSTIKKSFKECGEFFVERYFPSWVRRLIGTSKSQFPEGDLVVVADYVELYLYCAEERTLGNRRSEYIEIMKTCRRVCATSAFPEMAEEYMNRIDKFMESGGGLDEPGNSDGQGPKADNRSQESDRLQRSNRETGTAPGVQGKAVRPFLVQAR